MDVNTLFSNIVLFILLSVLAVFFTSFFLIILDKRDWALNILSVFLTFLFSPIFLPYEFTAFLLRRYKLTHNKNDLPYKYLKHPALQLSPHANEWYIVDNNTFTRLEDHKQYQAITDYVSYTGNKGDSVEVDSWRNQRETEYLEAPYFKEHSSYRYVKSDFSKLYTDTVYNARYDKSFKLNGHTFFFFLLYHQYDNLRAEHEELVSKRESEKDHLYNDMKTDFKNQQVKETLERIDLPDEVKAKLGRIDADTVDLDRLSEDFKDSCVKYNAVYDELARYDELGEDIFSILTNPLDSGKDD